MSNYPPGYDGFDGTVTIHFRCTGTIEPEPGENEGDEQCPCQWDADGISECGAIVLDDDSLRYCPDCGAEGEQI